MKSIQDKLIALLAGLVVVLLVLLVLIQRRGAAPVANTATTTPSPQLSAQLEDYSLPSRSLLESSRTTSTTTLPSTTTRATTTAAPIEGVGETVTIIGSGDTLMHTWLINGGKKDDDWDYDYMFKHIRSSVEVADIAITDMEGTLAGEPYTGFPLFSAPDALARAMRVGGFNHVLTANNHAIDRSTAGLKRTIEVLREAGLTTVGTRLNTEEKNYSLVKHGGITVGLTGWTYETVRQDGRRALNGIRIPEEAVDLVNSYSLEEPWITEDFKRMADLGRKMREEGADLVVFLIHGGTEYQTTPTGYQVSLAKRLCEAGVDLIIGNGPHVIQPIHVLKSEDGRHETVVYYSVGNLVSDQYFDTANNKGYAEDGLLSRTRFTKQADGSMKIAEIAYLDTYCYKNKFASAATYNTPIPITLGLEDPGSVGLNSDQLWMLRNSAERTAGIMARNETGDYEVRRLTGRGGN